MSISFFLFHSQQSNTRHDTDTDALLCFFGAKISEGMIPSTTILNVLTLLSKMMPKAKLFPYKDLTELIIREPGKRKFVSNFVNQFLVLQCLPSN